MSHRLFALLLVPAWLTPLAAQRPAHPAPRPVLPAAPSAPADDPLRALAWWDAPPPAEAPVLWEPPMAWDESLIWDLPRPTEVAGVVEWSAMPDLDLPSLRDHLESALDGRWSLRAPRFARQSPEDSLYREGRELLNRGEYRRAAELFQAYERKNPGTRYAAAALYWRAFALYRAGTDGDLREALMALDEQRRRFKEAAADDDVAALVTRVTGALARRGDADAARRLREGAAQSAASCDREDMEVRAEALSALVQADPDGSADLLRRTLARRDECAVPLRRRAVYLLGGQGEAENVNVLRDVARSDPDARVRGDAINRIAQAPGGSAVPVLEQLFSQSDDPAVRRAVLQSLRRVEGGEASAFLRRVIERDDLDDDLRVEAVRSLGRSAGIFSFVTAPEPPPRGVRMADRISTVRRAGLARGRSGLSESDAAFLRAMYGRTSSRALRRAIVETLARSGGPENDQWLMGIVRNPAEDLRYRITALGRLRRAEVPVAELGRLYDTLSERDLRSGIVSILGEREEDAATDKLIEIAKTGTDPSIRRAAIGALSRKKDPRTTKLLMELVEK